MALRLSTGLRDAMMEKKATASMIKSAATTISFTNTKGANGGDQILDSGNGFASTNKRGKVTVYGSAANNSSFTVLSVSAGAIEVLEALTAAAAGASVTVMQATGGSFSDLFRNCVMRIFAGTQPSDADQAEGSTHLVEISLASAVFTPGAAGGAGGINFDDAVAGVLGKVATEVWSGIASASGTAGWFRIYDNARTTGSSTVAVRFDGAISTSGAQLNMSNTTITSGGTTTIDSGAVTLPTL